MDTKRKREDMRHEAKIGGQVLFINGKPISLDDIWSIVTLKPDWKNVSAANAHLGHLQHTINKVAAQNERLKEANDWLRERAKETEFVRKFPKLQKKEQIRAEIANDKDFYYFWEQDPTNVTFNQAYENRFKKLPRIPKRVDLVLDIIGKAYEGVDEHPTEIMKKLGIKYVHATPQSLGDCWWFWGCENIPKELPKYLSVKDLGDPNHLIGWGLSKEDASKIKSYEQLYNIQEV